MGWSVHHMHDQGSWATKLWGDDQHSHPQPTCTYWHVFECAQCIQLRSFLKADVPMQFFFWVCFHAPKFCPLRNGKLFRCASSVCDSPSLSVGVCVCVCVCAGENRVIKIANMTKPLKLQLAHLVKRKQREILVDSQI